MGDVLVSLRGGCWLGVDACRGGSIGQHLLSVPLSQLLHSHMARPCCLADVACCHGLIVVGLTLLGADAVDIGDVTMDVLRERNFGFS